MSACVSRSQTAAVRLSGPPSGGGVAKAGTSTGLGFMAFQSVQNVVFKEGEAWLDAPPPEEPEAAAEPEPEAAPASA